MKNLAIGTYKTDEEIKREREEIRKKQLEENKRIELERLEQEKARIEHEKKIRTRKKDEYVKLLEIFFNGDIENHRIKIQLNDDTTFILLPSQIRINEFNEILLSSGMLEFYSHISGNRKARVDTIINDEIRYMEILKPTVLHDTILFDGKVFKLDEKLQPNAKTIDVDYQTRLLGIENNYSVYDNSYSNVNKYVVNREQKFINSSGYTLINS